MRFAVMPRSFAANCRADRLIATGSARHPAARPRFQLGAYCADNPLADRDDHAGFLQQRHEFPGQYQPVVRAPPAQQRFESGDLAALQVRFRLVINQELPPLQRAPQAVFKIQPVHRAGVHLPREELEVVPARILGAVHRGIRILDQRITVIAVGRVHADADTRGHVDLVMLEHERSREHPQDFLCRQTRILGAVQIAQDNAELVPAHAPHRIAHAHAFGKPLCDLLQQQVADAMTERVIGDLEAVEIEKHHGHHPAAALRLRQQLPQAVVEQHAVRQTGEAVEMRHVDELFFGFLALGNVLRDARYAINLIGRIPHRERAVPDPADGPVLAHDPVRFIVLPESRRLPRLVYPQPVAGMHGPDQP